MNAFALSGLFTGISCVGFGLFVFFIIPNRTVGRIWCLFALSVGLWGFGALAVSCTHSPREAMQVWHYSYMLGVIWIAPLYYHFICTFLELKRRRSILIHYLIAAACALLVPTPYFFTRIQFLFDSLFYARGGVLYPFYFSWWLGLILFAHVDLLRVYRRVDSSRQNQIRYFFLATGISFTGGCMAYLPNFGVAIYPWGNFAIPLYPVVMSYAITRHRLMDIGLVAREALTKALALFLVAVPLVMGRIFAEIIITMHGLSLSRTVGHLCVTVFSYSIAIMFLRHYEELRARRLIQFLLLMGTWNAGEILLDIPPHPGTEYLFRCVYAIGVLTLLAWFEFWHAYFTNETKIQSRLYRTLRGSGFLLIFLTVGTSTVIQSLSFDPTFRRPAYEIPGPAYAVFISWFLAALTLMAVWTALQAIKARAMLTRSARGFILGAFAFGIAGSISYFCYATRVLVVAVHPYFVFGLNICLVGSLLQRMTKHAWSHQPLSIAIGATSLTFPFAAGALMTHGAYGQIAAGILLLIGVPRILFEIEGSVRDWVDVLVFRGRYTYLKELAQIRQEAFRYINLRELLNDSLDRVVQAMRLERGAVYLHNLTTNTYESMVERPVKLAKQYSSFSDGDPLLESLRRDPQCMVTMNGQPHFALALANDQKVYGFFLLGRKIDGSELQEHDLKELAELMGTLQKVLWYTHAFYEQSLMLSKFTHDNLRYAGNIRRAIELITGGFSGGELSPQMSRFAQIIDGEAMLLEEYLNDLRQSTSILSQRLSGVYVLKPYDLVEILRQITESYRVRALKQNIHLTSPFDGLAESEIRDMRLPGWGEARSIRHIIENLLSNAFKFTPSGGTIGIGARSLGENLEITVSDTGPGIPETELPHIFDLFYQGKGREYMHQSTGLGLSIVKEIVAIHHGNIEVSSQEGKGTTFYIRLPSATSRIATAA